MITLFNASDDAAKPAGTPATSVPIEQLVEEAYAWAPPQAQDHMLSKLVGKVFETASLHMKMRLLEQLLRPAGLLSLLAVANGVFAKIRFRGGWPDAHLYADDLQTIQSGDVVALVEHVLQMGGNVLDGLNTVLLQAPPVAQCGAAVVLLSILRQRAVGHRACDRPVDQPAKELPAIQQPVSLFATL